jgi:hypothetical protein
VNVTDLGVPVGELVADVKRAIRAANVSASDGRDMRVASVELTLHAVAVGATGGGLDFRVPVIGARLRIGGKVTRQDTHTITVTLVPPPGPAYEVRGERVQQALVEAIGTIRAVLRDAGAGEDPFVLGTGTVEMSFVVTAEGTISLGVEGELRDEVTHGLKLELAPVT